MTNETVDRTKSRRLFLAAIAATPIAALPVLAAPPSDVQSQFAKWFTLDAEIAAVKAKDAAAVAAMLEWAAPGPKYLKSDGTYYGETSPWARDDSVAPPESDDFFRIVRQSPHDARRDFDVSRRIYSEQRVKAVYIKRLRLIARLRNAQRAEEEKVCLPALREKRSELSNRRYDLSDGILNSTHNSHDAIAAKIITGLWNIDGSESLDGVNFCAIIPALKALAPLLSGAIATCVADLIAADDARRVRFDEDEQNEA